ncbi:transcriptional regulator, partial [Streptomyces rubiginosohelvolus]
RTFRVDRVSEPFATGARFTPRPLPVEGGGEDGGGGGAEGAARYFARSMAGRQPELRLDVWFAAPAEFVAARLPPTLGVPESVPGPDGENAGGENSGNACRLRSSCTDSLEWVALRLALVDCEFTVQGPPELVEHLGRLGARLTRAAGAPR